MSRPSVTATRIWRAGLCRPAKAAAIVGTEMRRPGGSVGTGSVRMDRGGAVFDAMRACVEPAH
ncbi:MAG TPA: hypothetical protein DCY37_00225 [Acidaminococcaceae bacterium]|nr:hypothetical protein [Acidaminococcaceae bacterium]